MVVIVPLRRYCLSRTLRRSFPVVSSYHDGTDRRRSLLLRRRTPLLIAQERQVVGLVGAAARHFLKLRYFLATGVIGGSVAARTWYDEWKSNLPDFNMPDWVKFDGSPAWKELSDGFAKMKEKFGGDSNNEKFAEWISNLKFYEKKQRSENGKESQNGKPPIKEGSLLALMGVFGTAKEEDSSQNPNESIEEKLKKLQDEMIKTQSQYQRELERLEKENKVLKQRLLLKDQGAEKRMKRLKRSLIDMYSEVLDLLNEYDSSYNTADNLPRVVVVGDQSAGKTSVLEMIAQARIFPRGSGEMMTRAPVKVTLSEGPYHVAQFKDSTREFDLTKEADLSQLRSEIEVRMRNSVKDGRSVSNEVIALTVKGPNLPRMVLVDLPGVISTVTADMAKETKNDIIRMSKSHMENPNAIILCIQDGSVDAERSNVTDLVSSIDPTGRRTILVLTKVDMAEKNLANPDRIRKILEGKLFQMKALGYYGVVTGRGNTSETIDDIRKYEEEFFSTSKLLRDGVLKPSQMTTRNMSLAVSDCFWRMVKDSIESQTDAFRATRFNLETEWKNTFPRVRQLDRDELFDKARGEILDEIVNLSLVGAEEWEHVLNKLLWESIADHFYDQILMPANNSESVGSFNTLIDIRLKQWVERDIAKTSVETGWKALSDVFAKQVSLDAASRRDHDPIFDALKMAVLDEAMTSHHWDDKAMDYLTGIQLNAVEDKVVPDRKSWESACGFMLKTATDRLADVKKKLSDARGPGIVARWIYWQTASAENHFAAVVQDELQQIFENNMDHPQALTEEDITVVRRSLETKGVIEVPISVIRDQWKLIYKQHFLEKLIQSSRDCQSFYQHYKQGLHDNEVDCQIVILFYRLQKMISLTCSALRQQITSTEQRRLEKEIKDVLDDWSQETQKKKQLLTGRRVELAEELNQVRRIQEKLEEFMVQLQREK